MSKVYCLWENNNSTPLDYDCPKKEAIKFLTELGRHPELPLENRRVARCEKVLVCFSKSEIYNYIENELFEAYDCEEDNDHNINHYHRIKEDECVKKKIDELINLLNEKYSFNEVYTWADNVSENWITLEMLRGEGI